MKWFHNLKITVRLILGFSVVAILCGVIGFYMNSQQANSTLGQMIAVILVEILISIVIGVFIARSISKPLQEGLSMLLEMKKGHLNNRLNIVSNNEIGQLAAALDEFADDLEHIIVDTMKKISQGNLEVNIVPKDEQDEISPALIQTLDTMKNLIHDMEQMAQAHEAGDIDVMMPVERYEGAYRVVSEGVNEMVNGHDADIKKVLACIGEFAKGNFDAELEKFPGKKVMINDNFEPLRKKLKDVDHEIGKLILAAREGKLSERANWEIFQGDWAKLIKGLNETIDALVDPINVAAEYVDRISKGDLPPKITDTYNGDFNELKNNLNNCIDNINALVTDANMLEKAAVEGKLDTRADAAKHHGDYRKIVEGVNNTLDAVIGPLNVAAEYVDRISKGEIPPKITDSYNGDFNEIKNNLNSCIENINALVADANMLVTAAVEGKLATRADAAKHGGDYRRIVEGVNKTLDAVIGPLNVAADYVDRISKGDLPPKITDPYYGDFNTIKNNLNNCIDNINALVADANMLEKAAIEGKLDTRADAAKHHGDYRKIVEGVNNTLDAVIGPLNVAAEYVDRISKGEIPPKITDSYNGDFNEIKNNLNNCIENINALVADANMLVTAAVEGKLATRADAAKHGGDYRRIVEGVNKTLDAVIGPLNVAADYVDKISTGNIPPKITDAYYGDFNTIKNNLNNCIDHINALVADANMLEKAAIEGKLATRADASKHSGDYRKIVEGVNKTLDAVIAPVMESSAVLEEMSKGNLNISVKGNYQGDHAKIKNALNDTISTLSSYVGEIAQVLTQMADGDLGVEIINDYRGDFTAIKKSLNNIIQAFNEVLGNINNASREVAAGSRQVSDSAQSLSQGSTEQASAIEQLTASLEEISTQTQHNAKNADQANTLALAAKGDATVGNDQMKEMLKAMDQINESSSNISKIIKVIDEIAFQTNNLALNAAVEAARAGQYGKGFAVVAEEVRNLATRSANAAKETTLLIEGSIKKVEDGTHIAKDTAEALGKIVDGVAKAASLVGEIAAASNEQALGINQINQGIQQVASVVQMNSSTSEESAAASEQLSSQAEMLRQEVSHFKLKKIARASRSDMYENLNPDVMQMIEGMSQKKRVQDSNVSPGYSEAAAASAKPKIALSDFEFGKY